MGIAEVLFIVFLVLKLIGAITWLWWLVTAPLWGTYVIGGILFVLFGGFATFFGRQALRR